MNDGNFEPVRYTRTAIWLHWILAIFIIANLLIGFNLDSAFKESRGFAIFIHASIGFSVLGLVVLRVLWRVANRAPELGSAISGPERLLAKFAHFFLYVAMIVIPISGWAIISTNPPANSPGAEAIEALQIDAHPSSGFKVWGVINVPAIAPLNELGRTVEGVRSQSKLHGSFEALHEFFASVLATLIILHVLAAAKHQLFDRVDLLARMGLRERRSSSGKNQKR